MARKGSRLLGQVSKRDPGTEADLSFIGIFSSHDELKERGFPGPVWTDQGKTFPLIDLERDLLQESLVPERLRYIFQRDHKERLYLHLSLDIRSIKPYLLFNEPKRTKYPDCDPSFASFGSPIFAIRVRRRSGPSQRA